MLRKTNFSLWSQGQALFRDQKILLANQPSSDKTTPTSVWWKARPYMTTMNFPFIRGLGWEMFILWDWWMNWTMNYQFKSSMKAYKSGYHKTFSKQLVMQMCWRETRRRTGRNIAIAVKTKKCLMYTMHIECSMRRVIDDVHNAVKTCCILIVTLHVLYTL